MKAIKLIFKLLFFPITIALWLIQPAQAYNEAHFTNLLAKMHDYRTEVKVKGFRIDLVSETHAIEVDWGYKMYEAIGQALVYAQATGKMPGMAILLATERDERTFKKIKPYAEAIGITVTSYRVDKKKGKLK